MPHTYAPNSLLEQYGNWTTCLLAEAVKGQIDGISRDCLLDRVAGQDRSAGGNRQLAARRLGRLFSERGLHETVGITGSGRAIGLHASALLMLRVDTEGMRRDRHWFDPQRPLRSLEGVLDSGQQGHWWDYVPIPTQEILIKLIVRRTRDWVDKEARPQEPHRDPLVPFEDLPPTTLSRSDRIPCLALLDAIILHGGPFDVAISVMAEEVDQVMRFARDVLASTRHVRETQTVMIAYRHSSMEDRARSHDHNLVYGRIAAILDDDVMPLDFGTLEAEMKPQREERPIT
jgi:hypothetical protein